MPPILPNRAQRAMQVLLANPAQQARANASQQQGGTSGTIPGAASSVTNVATQTGLIQPYPAAANSPNGDAVAGVGHQIMNEGGSSPVAVMGNLQLTQAGVTYADRSVAFLDNAGNVVAWHGGSDGWQQLLPAATFASVSGTVTIAYVSKVMEFNSATAVALYIDVQSNTGIPVGAYVKVCQLGAGKITVTPASGAVTIQSPGGLRGTRVQYSTIGLRQRDVNVWVLDGDLG